MRELCEYLCIKRETNVNDEDVLLSGPISVLFVYICTSIPSSIE